MTEIRVLYVDDESDFLDVTSDFLREKGFEVESYETVGDGLDAFDEGRFDCVVSDYEMPERNGIEFLEEIRERDSDVPFIMFTGKGTEKVASEAISKGVTDYILKGVGDEESKFEVLAKRIEEAVEKRRTQEKLQDTEERYRRLVEDAPIGIVVQNGAEIVYVNDTAVEITNAESKEEAIGTHPLEYFPEESYERIAERVRKTVEGDRDEHVAEEKYFDHEGNERYLYATSSPVKYEGETCLQVIFQDITDRKKKEKDLERHKRILEAAGDAVYALDDEGYVTEVNDYLVELSGYSRDELLGEYPDFLLSEGDLEKLEEKVRKLLSEEERKVITSEIDLHTADDEVVPCEVRTTLLPSEDGDFTGTVGILRDITDRKKREERLENFASVVSHDLRNPLSVIAANVRLGREKGDEKYFERVDEGIHRMERIIDDLLTLAQNDEGIERKAEIEVEEAARSAWGNVDTESVEMEIGDPGTVEGDPGRFKNLLENLFGNSVEHGGEDTKLRIRIGSLDDVDGFYVEDSGVGIPEHRRSKVFEHGYTTSDEGTGFGLSIVKDIADSHGWEIEVKESESGGARFEFVVE